MRALTVERETSICVLTLLLLSLTPALHAANIGIVTYSPAVISPGGTLTISGSGVAPGNGSVAISVVAPTGQRIQLGIAAVIGGSFNAALAVPASAPLGTYLFQVATSLGQSVINLTGNLALIPPGTPWFGFTPLGAAPGQPITVSAAGFGGSSMAVVKLANSLNQIVTLGSVALSGGAFTHSFTIPTGLALNTAWSVNVFDSTGAQALNTAGPLTVGNTAPSVPIGGYPVGVAVNAGTNRIYVPNSRDSTLSVLDGSTNIVIATVPVGQLPCAIGINQRTNRIYVANLNDSSVSVLDGVSNTVIATVPVGPKPCAVTVTPNNNRIFTGNYAGNNLSVIDGVSNTVIATVALRGLPGGIGSNTTTGMVYASNGFDNSVAVVDGTTNTIVATIPVGGLPDAIATDPYTNRVYVGNYLSRSVSIIDGNTNTVVKTVAVGVSPSGAAVDPLTHKAYVTNYSSASVSVIDGGTGSVIATIPVGLIPDGVALNPYTGMVYTANSDSNSVSVIPE